MEKNSFLLYDEYAEHFLLLSMEQRGVLITAIFAYCRKEELPIMDGTVNMAFSFIKAQLLRDNERYEEIIKKRSDAGKLGGRPKKQTKAKKANDFSEKQTKANESKKSHNDNVNDNVNDINKEKSTYVLKKKATERTDERSEKQKEFFETYPNIVIDNYSTSDYAEIDFYVLMQRFAESSFLRQSNSFSWICSHYRQIAAGEYRDYEKRMRVPIDSGQGKKLGSEWDDLE